MPPDRGSLTKTKKTDLKNEGKLSSLGKDKKAGDVNSAVPSKSKEEIKNANNSPLLRQKPKIKKEEITGASSGKVAKSSRTDVAKLKDVKKDLVKDLKNVRETLAKNRSFKSTPYKPTATRASVSERISSETVNSRSSTGSVVKKKAPVAQAGARKVQQTSSSVKTRASDVSKHPDNSSKFRKDIPAQSQNKEKGDKQPKKLSRERTRTRTLSPHEVKMAKGIPSVESQHTSEFSKTDNEIPAVPSTSNLPKGYPADSHPEVSSRGHPEKLNDSDDNYEDDFEDYESDFEDDIPGSSEDSHSVKELGSDSGGSSADESNESADEEVVELSNRPVVEEEKKLDSGNYDLTESKRKGKEIQQIKEALEKENANVPAVGTTKKSSLVKSLSLAQDEGFEEEKSEERKPARDLRSAVLINFTRAKKKMEEQKITAKARKRGEEVLSMIRLDTVNFSLLDLPPVPYEVYMKSYGRSNTQQVSVQTNEDNLCEEIQTEEILMKEKWTQYPVAYHPVVSKDDVNASHFRYWQDHRGSGGESEQDPELWKKLIKYNAGRLNQFLLNAGKAILQYLEQQSLTLESSVLLNSSTSNFSKGYFKLQVNSVPFLAGRPVSMLCFSDLQPTTLLTVHSPPNKSQEAFDDVLERCMLCVWNILKPSIPEKVLVCSNNVTSVCFHQNIKHLVFSGLCEGTVCVWDLREKMADHCWRDECKEDWVIRSPTYSTAEILKNDGHLTEVCAVCAIGSSLSESPAVKENIVPIQVCSLDISGVAIIWTVIQSTRNGLKSGLAQQDLGLAYWGKVRLVRSIVINVFECLDSWIFFCHLYGKHG